ncbi:MAG: hypothetical protein AMXMBFR60_20360 [Chloroflexota bacterium]
MGREETIGVAEAGGTVSTVSVEGGGVCVAVGGAVEVNVSVGIGEEVKVGIGVSVCAAGWKGVADADVCGLGKTISAKGSGVGVGGEDGREQERRREERRKKVISNR